MELLAKIALLSGLFMVVTPSILRMNDVIDNSVFTAIFVVGILLVALASNNWSRREGQFMNRD